MELRTKKKVNYRTLDRGEPIKTVPEKTWSTSKLWQLETLDSRLNDQGQEELFVHYIGWPKSFDEWRLASDITDSKEHEHSDAYQLLLSNLKVQVKENLTLSRIQDTEVTIKVPVQRETFGLLTKNIGALPFQTSGSRIVYRLDRDQLGKALGNNWWHRIGNEAGDFAYVNDDTLQLWLTERSCLVEYTPDLQKKSVHRGFFCTLRFVKQTANNNELYLLNQTA